MKAKIVYFFIFFASLAITFSLVYYSCGEDLGLVSSSDVGEIPEGYADQAEYDPAKDKNIQRYNLNLLKKEAVNRTPCDTLAAWEWILDNYPEGTYLMTFDRTFTYTATKPAIMYYDKTNKYVLAVIVASREGERFIDVTNIVGYDESYIDYDSTDLGTAFPYLILLRCNNNNFELVWEAQIPSHGGFRDLTLHKWDYKGTPYIRCRFYYSQGEGHIDYNYFLINGLEKQPHLLMTYFTINSKRSMANVNNDEFPDYYEHRYYDVGTRIFSTDSVAWYWSEKDTMYINTRNNKQSRKF